MKSKISLPHLLLLLFYSFTLPLSVGASPGPTAPPTPLNGLNTVFGSLITGILTLVGAVSVIMLLAGGFQYFSAGGDKEAASRAWRTITYAILGLILATSAYMLLSLLGTFLGIPLGTFNICITGGC